MKTNDEKQEKNRSASGCSPSVAAEQKAASATPKEAATGNAKEPSASKANADESAAKEESVLMSELVLDDYLRSVPTGSVSAEEQRWLRKALRAMARGEASAEHVQTLLNGRRYEAAVADAEVAGFRRGRNEKISEVNHFDTVSQYLESVK